MNCAHRAKPDVPTLWRPGCGHDPVSLEPDGNSIRLIWAGLRVSQRRVVKGRLYEKSKPVGRSSRMKEVAGKVQHLENTTLVVRWDSVYPVAAPRPQFSVDRSKACSSSRGLSDQMSPKAESLLDPWQRETSVVEYALPSAYILSAVQIDTLAMTFISGYM